MSSWLQKLRNGGYGNPPDGRSRSMPIDARKEKAPPEKPKPMKPDPKDPNTPQKRLQLHQKSLYERTLPGKAFISAHVNRLQHGFYENGALHEGPMENVYFVSVHFVFHPHDPRSHRFKSAVIKVSIHGDQNSPEKLEDSWYAPPIASPRILRHAPELIYGAVSPENLQWNFSLSSSLGVSQAPVSASLNPKGGVRSEYKIYDMMSIQGSLRSQKSPLGPEYDIEDAMAIWTLEENLLQRSGLPREFDFVLLVYKPEDVKNVYLSVDVDAVVETWFGEYPQWYTNLPKFMPSQDLTLDFNRDIGQRFLPNRPGRGFNFADLPHPLEEYVIMPGTVYPTNDTSGGDTRGHSGRTFDDYDNRNQYDDQDRFYDPDRYDDPARYDEPVRYRDNNSHRMYMAMLADKAVEASPVALDQPFTPRNRYTVTGQQPASAPTPKRQSWAPDTLNVRVMLEHSSPRSPSARRYPGSPLSYQEPTRRHSIRRRRSRSELKEYSAQQALQDIARDTLKEKNEEARLSRTNGSIKTKDLETKVNGNKVNGYN